jgi:hypothetical protein
MLLLVIEAPSEYFLPCPVPVAFTAKRTLLCVFLLISLPFFFVGDPVGFRRGEAKKGRDMQAWCSILSRLAKARFL